MIKLDARQNARDEDKKPERNRYKICAKEYLRKAIKKANAMDWDKICEEMDQNV